MGYNNTYDTNEMSTGAFMAMMSRVLLQDSFQNIVEDRAVKAAPSPLDRLNLGYTNEPRYPYLRMLLFQDGKLRTAYIENTPENIAAFILYHQNACGEISIQSPDQMELMIANRGYIHKALDAPYLTNRLNPVLNGMRHTPVSEPEAVDPSLYDFPEGRLYAFYEQALLRAGMERGEVYGCLEAELGRMEARMPDMSGEGMGR